MTYAQDDSPLFTDEEIVTLYQKGDLEVFKRIINRYSAPLYNFAARLTNKNDAPDIVQEVFIKVWKNLNRFNPSKASFKTWIFAIAKNTITDFLRKKRNLLFSDIEKNDVEDFGSFEESIRDEQILPDIALQKLQDIKFFNNILNKLEPNNLEVLMLHYQEDMTFDEIGKILNKSLNTVKSQHRRALMKLRKMLE